MRRVIFAILPVALVDCSPSSEPATVKNLHDVPPVVIRSATPFDAEHSAAVAKNPPGVSFVVRTVDGRSRFADGEPIRLELLFSSSVAEKYQLDLAAYDRSGRLWSESFPFDPPTGVVDPLADYFGEMRGGMGGIRPMPATLSDKPTQVEVVLNEWARFTGPGKLRFFVRSTRVSPPPEAEAASNVVELDIVTDAGWDERELTRIRRVLDVGGDGEAQRGARKALRFLTSKAAVGAMVDDLCRLAKEDDEHRWQTHAGLFGTPHRADAVAMLEAGLAAPDCAITSEHLRTLTRLKLASAGVRQPSVEDQRRVSEPLLTALIAGLSRKSDDARAASLVAALDGLGDHRAPARALALEALRANLARVLARLPEPTLARLLESEWQLIRSAAMAAPLLALVREARPRGSRLRSISDLALERLLELDHDAARDFILAEIARAGGTRLSFSGKTFGLLQDAELPHLDAALIDGLQAPERDGTSLELRAELFARYASKRALKEAWAGYKAVAYFRISLLSYLARHDPRAAEAEIKRIQDFDSLQRLSRFLWSAALEAAVIKQLDAVGGAQAAPLLAERGSASVERVLWDRFGQLPAGADKQGLASAMRSAIIQGKAWITPPDKLRKLAKLCKDEECKRQVTSTESRWGEGGARPALVLWSTRTGLTGWLGHYEVRSAADLRVRIGQLPPGITLEWQTKPEDVDVALMEQVRSWAKARKVEIVAR